jgi:hypothetical protein
MNSRTFRLTIEITATPKVPSIEAGSTDEAHDICKRIAMEVQLITQRLVGSEYQVSEVSSHVIY